MIRISRKAIFGWFTYEYINKVHLLQRKPGDWQVKTVKHLEFYNFCKVTRKSLAIGSACKKFQQEKRNLIDR